MPFKVFDPKPAPKLTKNKITLSNQQQNKPLTNYGMQLFIVVIE